MVIQFCTRIVEKSIKRFQRRILLLFVHAQLPTINKLPLPSCELPNYMKTTFISDNRVKLHVIKHCLYSDII